MGIKSNGDQVQWGSSLMEIFIEDPGEVAKKKMKILPQILVQIQVIHAAPSSSSPLAAAGG